MKSLHSWDGKTKGNVIYFFPNENVPPLFPPVDQHYKMFFCLLEKFTEIFSAPC